MAKRYLICPVIGNGTAQSPYRAAAQDVGTTAANSIIPTHTEGPNLGKPKYGFAFCIVNTENLLAVYQITNAYVFPDHALDTQMGAMEEGARIALKQSAEAYDLDGEGLNLDASFELTESYRQVLDRIGKQFESVFSINYFDAN